MPKIDNTFSVLGVFSTIRFNLAYANALMKNSYIDDPSKFEGSRLGFLNSPSIDVDVKIYNSCRTKILIAFLYQALKNYLDLVGIDPGLRDEDLESLLDQHGHRKEFIECLRISRNHVFHISGTNSIEQDIKNDNKLNSILKQRGGHKASADLLDALYDFTWKVFGRELHIYPEWQYEMTESEMEKMRE